MGKYRYRFQLERFWTPKRLGPEKRDHPPNLLPRAEKQLLGGRDGSSRAGKPGISSGAM